jgi:hypothetical protein
MTGGGETKAPAYHIVVRGHLGATTLRAVPGLRAERKDRDTLLRGPIADQAALHGVLAQIEALGLELLEVRRLPPQADHEHPREESSR